jgi:hypothetical protein
MRVNLDSASRGGVLAFPQSLGLKRLLFRTACALIPDLLLDLNSGVIPLVTGTNGDKQVGPMPGRSTAHQQVHAPITAISTRCTPSS